MYNIIKKAVKNFTDSVEAEISECKDENANGYTGKISVHGDENYDIYIVIPDEKLSYIAKYYFGEEEFDAEDLTKEIANQIIGNAKIIAAEKNISFDISVPEFLGKYEEGLNYDESMAFRFNNGKCFHIFFKGK